MNENTVLNAASVVATVLNSVTEEERMAVMEKINIVFCKYCWRRLDANERCYCWNDE